MTDREEAAKKILGEIEKLTPLERVLGPNSAKRWEELPDRLNNRDLIIDAFNILYMHTGWMSVVDFIRKNNVPCVRLLTNKPLILKHELLAYYLECLGLLG